MPRPRFAAIPCLPSRPPRSSGGGEAEQQEPLDREPTPSPTRPARDDRARRRSSAIRPPRSRPDITGGGYVFPVYGLVVVLGRLRRSARRHGLAPRQRHLRARSAPRCSPWPTATLFLVGWNTLGGHRLWLRDGQGNEYYYAHLSAYSPLAVRRRAGRGGRRDRLRRRARAMRRRRPSHLHFEIHPAALLGLGYDGVDQSLYRYLLAW